MEGNTLEKGIDLSIIIPLYNTPLVYLKECLESIVKANLRYTFEIIIVNDGSTDERTNEYCAQLRQQGYQVVMQENKGLSAARNTGIALAKGDYILPLDADNKIRPAYITRSIQVLDNQPSVAVVPGARTANDRTVGESSCVPA